MAAVARAIGDMNPSKISFIDCLIYRQLQLHEQVIKTGIVEPSAYSDVGGLAFHMLTVRCASNGTVQFRATVTAVHMNGTAPCFTQGVEYLFHKSVQVLDRLGWRCVNDAQTLGCN